MTKNLLLVLILLFPSCVSSIPTPCGQRSRAIQPQTNAVENLFGQEIFWRQQDLPVLVIIDPHMREMRKQVVIEAINTWNLRTGTVVFTYEIAPLVSRAGVICISEEDLGPPDICGSQVLGLTRRFFSVNGLGVKVSISKAMIKLHTGVPNSRILGTTIHELGHACGLNHDVNVNSIMYPYSLPNRGGITQEDIDFVRRMVTRGHTIEHPIDYPIF